MKEERAGDVLPLFNECLGALGRAITPLIGRMDRYRVHSDVVENPRLSRALETVVDEQWPTRRLRQLWSHRVMPTEDARVADCFPKDMFVVKQQGVLNMSAVVRGEKKKTSATLSDVVEGEELTVEEILEAALRVRGERDVLAFIIIALNRAWIPQQVKQIVTDDRMERIKSQSSKYEGLPPLLENGRNLLPMYAAGTLFIAEVLVTEPLYTISFHAFRSWNIAITHDPMRELNEECEMRRPTRLLM
jgi:hypothetical protein